MISLKEHQKVPIKFMKANRGLILFHSTGSGKTLTALYAVYQFDNEIIIVGSRSTKKTFNDNIEKAKMNPSRFTFYTYAKIKKLLEDNIMIFKNASVIIDEAHNIRTENMHNLYITSALIFAHKIILLSATPIINYFNDLAILINIVKGEDVLPTERKLFEQMFYDEEKMELINQDYLVSKMKNTISYYKMENDENYPRSTKVYERVEMDSDQMREYVYHIKKIIYDDKKIDSDHRNIFDIDYGLLPSKKKNFFFNVTRQLSNTSNKYVLSPKISAILEKILAGPYPIIVYSNFLKNGIYLLALQLDKNNISYKTISGNTNNDKINLIVNNYNKGAYKVLLISSAGSESLDLKNTRQIHIMEPHWNNSKLDQVIGRSIRYKSHATLPPADRHVTIYYWASVFPPNIKNMSADEYLMELSKKKEDLWKQYIDLIKRASIEYNIAVPKRVRTHTHMHT